MEYPEHEKLENINEQSQFVGEFLEWLNSTNRCIATQAFDGFGKPALREDTTTIQALLAEFFQIDLRKIEAEKQQMLAKLQTASI